MVNVGVISDLNFKQPAAKEQLMFQRKNYVKAVTTVIEEFLPSKKKK